MEAGRSAHEKITSGTPRLKWGWWTLPLFGRGSQEKLRSYDKVKKLNLQLTLRWRDFRRPLESCLQFSSLANRECSHIIGETNRSLGDPGLT